MCLAGCSVPSFQPSMRRRMVGSEKTYSLWMRPSLELGGRGGKFCHTAQGWLAVFCRACVSQLLKCPITSGFGSIVPRAENHHHFGTAKLFRRRYGEDLPRAYVSPNHFCWHTSVDKRSFDSFQFFHELFIFKVSREHQVPSSATSSTCFHLQDRWLYQTQKVLFV